MTRGIKIPYASEDPPSGRSQAGGYGHLCAALAVTLAVAVGATSCAALPHRHRADPAPSAPRTRLPHSATTVLSGPPGWIAAAAAQTFFASAPVVVLADPGHPGALTAAAVDSGRSARAVPADPRAAGQALVSRALQAQIRALKPRAVLASWRGRRRTCALAAGDPYCYRPGNAACHKGSPAPEPGGAARAPWRLRCSDGGGGYHGTGRGRAGDRCHRPRPPGRPGGNRRAGAVRPRQSWRSAPGSGPREGWHYGSPSPRPGSSCPAADRYSFPSTGWSRCTGIPAPLPRGTRPAGPAG